MISMRLIRMPHLSVTASICCCTSVLMFSRSDSAWSSVIVPMTDRSAVRAKASMPTSKLAMLNNACSATTIWVKIVALTVTTTLSLVITSWRSPGRGISRMSTRCSESTNGAMMTSPGSCVLLVLTEVLDDPDLTLLDDVDHLAQGHDEHHQDQGHDDEPHDPTHCHPEHVGHLSPSSVSGPVSVTPKLDRQVPIRRPHDQRGPLDPRDQHLGAGGQRHVGAAAGQPALAGEHHVARPVSATDDVEREDLLADQPTVHARARCDHRGWPAPR